MTYEYSTLKKLDAPHTYMYAPYKGELFMEEYRKSRREVLARDLTNKYSGDWVDFRILLSILPDLNIFCADLDGDDVKSFRVTCDAIRNMDFPSDHLNDNYLKQLPGILEFTSVSEVTDTFMLLQSIIANLLMHPNDSSVKTWIDRLVQRVEVTKKLYESYAAGFRRGFDSSSNARLYWLFILALTLYYIGSKELKYLSTLLKVSDILCSLSHLDLQKSIPPYGISITLIMELIFINSLANGNKALS